MKEKFLISIEDGFRNLRIKELTDLEKKDVFIVICEEIYDLDKMKEAVSEGEDALVSRLKTVNFYPTGPWARRIAAGVIDLYNSGKDGILTLVFDDKEEIPKRRRRFKEVIEEEDLDDFEENEADELEDGLEDGLEDLFGVDEGLSRPGSSIKIADDDQMNIADDI